MQTCTKCAGTNRAERLAGAEVGAQAFLRSIWKGKKEKGIARRNLPNGTLMGIRIKADEHLGFHSH